MESEAYDVTWQIQVVVRVNMINTFFFSDHTVDESLFNRSEIDEEDKFNSV